MKHIKTALLDCLQHLKGSGKFATVRTAHFTLPGLQVNGVGEIAFPLNDVQAKGLIQIAAKAPFGKGTETIVDTTVRSAWEIDPQLLTFRNPEWQTFIDQAVRQTVSDLGLEGYTIDAHLYKLLIYEEGDFFLRHKDSEKESGMFGTMVVGLPSFYTGGELVINFDGTEVVADFSAPIHTYQTNWVAFYADCDHEVKRLRSGHRICLIYNLIQKQAGSPVLAPSVGKTARQLAEILRNNPADKPYIILLGHQYTPENFSQKHLKLDDRVKAEALLQAAQQLGHYAALCLVTSYKSGLPDSDTDIDDNADMVEVFDESYYIEHWAEGSLPALGRIPFEEDDLIASFILEDDEPIVKESSGYMGNYGPDLMHWYHYGAVMIWTSDQNANILKAQFKDRQLDWIAHFNRTKSMSPAEVGAIKYVISAGLRHRYSPADSSNLNSVAEWISSYCEPDFLLHVNIESLQSLFKGADIPYLSSLMSSLTEPHITQILKRLSDNHDPAIMAKLCSFILALSNDERMLPFATIQVAQLPIYLASQNDYNRLALPANAVSDLFKIEIRFAPGISWISAICAAITAQISRTYIHSVLAPRLLVENSKALLREQLLQYCRSYLQIRTQHKPKPPVDWSRPVPASPYNQNVWRILKPFMESPHEQIFDYRRVQDERKIMEDAIANTDVDLRTETIRKGSPHTLRIIKTQASYDRHMQIWQEDVILLDRILKHVS